MGSVEPVLVAATAEGTECRPAAGRRRGQPSGVLATAVLVLLLEQDGHGYDLAARLPDLGLDQPAAGGLYRTLRSLEDEGLLSSRWDGSGRGPARHVYRLTIAGRRHLTNSIDAIRTEARLLDRLAHRFCSIQPPTPSDRRPVMVDTAAGLDDGAERGAWGGRVRRP